MMESEIAVPEMVGNFEIARQEIARIGVDRNSLAPEVIVDEARSESSPIHCYFNWDDTDAAEKFRYCQAAGLVRRVRIKAVTLDQERKVLHVTTTRAFVSPKSLRYGNGSYKAIEEVLSDSVLRNDLLETAKRELLSLREKYRVLSELASVWDVIEKL